MVCLKRSNISFIETVINFQAQAVPFPPSFFNENALQMSPINWWKALKKYGVNSGFIQTAVQILSAPASSASIERIFSNFGHVHTKARNRLGNEKAFKLVFCYRRERQLDY